jgi:phosphate-selective porin
MDRRAAPRESVRLQSLLILALALLASLAAPRGAGAGEGDEAPAPEPSDVENSFEWNFRWEDGPVYEMWVLTPELQEQDRIGITRDLGVVGRIGGSLFLDGGFVSGEGLGNSWNVDLRRLRIETLGHVSHWLETDYKVSFGFEKDKAYLNDFWLTWKPGWVDRIRIGYIDPPFSIQALTTSQSRSFMEEPSPVSAFAPGYRLGLEARDRILDPDIAWTASLSSVGQSQHFRDASDSPFRFSLRAAWRPLGVPDDPDAQLLHFGVATSYSFSGTGEVHYRTRAESSLTPDLVDTGGIHGDAAQLGLEFARRSGPLRIEAEWLGSWVNASSGNRFFSGSYAEFGWALTGEIRGYDPKSALFTDSVPLQPFSWQAGAWGGLELAGRISYIDLTDRDLRGGRMLAVSGASVWSLNRFVRIHLDLIYADVKDRPGLGSNLIAQMRLELSM